MELSVFWTPLFSLRGALSLPEATLPFLEVSRNSNRALTTINH